MPVEVRVKLPADWAVIETCPGVPPVTFLLNRMMLEVVTAVEDTVTAPGLPDIAAVVPTDALVPVAIESLFPAVPRTRLPLVAVIFPNVAVSEVPAVIEVPADMLVPAARVVPEARVEVVAKDPGVVIAAGREIVATPATVVTVT